VSRNARIGITVGVIVGVVLIVATVIIIYFYCRRKQAVADAEKMKTAARILGIESDVSVDVIQLDVLPYYWRDPVFEKSSHMFLLEL